MTVIIEPSLRYMYIQINRPYTKHQIPKITDNFLTLKARTHATLLSQQHTRRRHT